MRVDEVILHFLEGENEGVEIKLTPPRELHIGRSEESDVFLGEKKISRKHCMIHVTEDHVRMVDLESTNGTFVNSKKITEVELHSGDRIKVGSSLIELDIQPNAGAESEASASTGSTIKKEKSEPKDQSKKAPAKTIKEKETFSSSVTAAATDEYKGKSKKELSEEDSDLVVEYQTAALEAMKEAKNLKDYETSEKIHPISAETSDAEFNEVKEYHDLDLDADHPEEEEKKSSSSFDEASINKILDLENLGEDSLDLSLDEEKLPMSSKPLVGDLSSMGLSDLLQNLHQNKKTGVLTLKTGTQTGKVFIREGVLTGPESGKAKGMKAIYRMLTWKNGDFEFQPLLNDSKELSTDQEPIHESIETILMEGFRQYDELRKIQKVLPQVEDDLALEDHLEIPLSKLHPKVLDVVQLIINHKKMKQVLDLSPLSDLETSKIVFYLIKKKVIKIKK